MHIEKIVYKGNCSLQFVHLKKCLNAKVKEKNIRLCLINQPTIFKTRNNTGRILGYLGRIMVRASDVNYAPTAFASIIFECRHAHACKSVFLCRFIFRGRRIIRTRPRVPNRFDSTSTSILFTLNVAYKKKIAFKSLIKSI